MHCKLWKTSQNEAKLCQKFVSICVETPTMEPLVCGHTASEIT